MLDPGPATPAAPSDDTEPATVLSSLGVVAAQGDALARAEQLVRLSAGLAQAEVACLVVHGEEGAVVQTLCSSDEPSALRLVRSVVGRPQRSGELPVRRIPVGMPAGPSGALYLLGGPPTDDQARDALVEQFVTLAAQLVENAVRHEESHQELAWRQALADVSQVLLRPSGDDETQVWQHIADHVQTLTRARTVTISAPSEDDPELLQVVVAAGLGRDQLPGLRFRRSGSLSQLAMSTRTSQTGTADDWTVSHTSVEPRAPLGPLLAIPLLGTGPPRGAIVLSREADRPPYSPRDITVAQDFATQATLALELAETRASQVVLQARTELEHVSDTPQDQVIQRLFALGLTLDRAAREDPQAWVDQARAEVAEAIAEARGSLRTEYGLDRADGGSV